MRFGNAQRGYLLNRIRPGHWETEIRVTDSVTDPAATLYRHSLITVPTARAEIDVV